MLAALASALRLDRHERDHLFRLAGRTPEPGAGEPEPLAAEVAATPLLLQPRPAYIIGSNYDVLGCNQAADELFPNLTTPTDRPANFVRWVFLAPVARDVVVDWEPEARGLLARLRTLAGRHPVHGADRRVEHGQRRRVPGGRSTKFRSGAADVNGCGAEAARRPSSSTRRSAWPSSRN